MLLAKQLQKGDDKRRTSDLLSSFTLAPPPSHVEWADTNRMVRYVVEK